MKNIAFVSIEKIKEKSIISGNTDEKIIRSALIEVQDLELQPLIGKTFFNVLADQIEKKEVTEENKVILDEVIQPYLVYGALIYSVVPLHFKLNNKGLNTSTDSNLSSASKAELDAFRGYYKEKFDGYKRRLIEYFENDESKETSTSPKEDTTSSFLGFHLPDIHDYSKEWNESKAYKTGYLRRN
ncbi:hypothetical protein OQZ33_07120 [Pedobacter sp. MC2016-05]|uniref:DUF6712 family protein n=1 Tax=Pedobacter sp. MC2016-05 TaxID=2994474 RepID=UPI002246579C|nr:hypothetical protein [Pedobacter sp. MC2016-05]MCX2474096.1 hypothetical protein [Pedobacter sp. MC2016-05]